MMGRRGLACAAASLVALLAAGSAGQVTATEVTATEVTLVPVLLRGHAYVVGYTSSYTYDTEDETELYQGTLLEEEDDGAFLGFEEGIVSFPDDEAAQGGEDDDGDEKNLLYSDEGDDAFGDSVDLYW